MFHPFLNARVRLATAAGLREKGRGFLTALQLAASVDDQTIADGLTATAADQGVTLPPELAQSTAPGAVGAIGDGKIIAAIIAFFQSPAGQALLAALVQALIALLAGA